MTDIIGVPQTIATFARLAVQAEAGEKLAEVAGAQVIVADMKARAPVSTGALRDSIRVSLTEEGAKVGATVPYARFVEFGTRYMDPQPFVGESVDAVGSKVGSAITAVFKRLLR